MYDLVIKNGRIVDGSGSPWFITDVGIRDGRVARIGLINEQEAERVIDAQGLIVAPGFVDIHSHADFVLPDADHLRILSPFLLQGITTVVTGNCGLSTAPVAPKHLSLLSDYTTFFQSSGFCFAWTSMGDYLDTISQNKVALNVVPLTSHGAVRIAVMGFAAGAPTEEQLTQMRTLVEQSINEGAFGLSAGLIYAPGMYASTEELIDITQPLKNTGAVFTCHVRGSSETALEATREVIEIGKANRIPVQHSHIEAFGEPYWPLIDQIIEMHDDARMGGVDVTFDVIPYTTANTFLSACFPPDALEGGMDDFVGRLSDPAERERLRYVVHNMRSEWPTWRSGTWPHNLVRATGWKNIRLLWAAKDHNAKYLGMSLEEIGKLQGKSAFDAAVDLLIDEHGSVLALYAGSSGDLETDEGLRKFMKHPNGAFNTDAILTGRGIPHPAAYGAFPRVLGHYVREERLLTLEEAVRKMTSLALRRFNVQDRGLLREGMWADVVVFDPNTVSDNATYLEPSLPPSGIEYVLVNGQLMVEHGEITGAGPAGHVLRR